MGQPNGQKGEGKRPTYFCPIDDDISCTWDNPLTHAMADFTHHQDEVGT